ncbi:MAG TPA: hypothetical protein VKD90_16645 [Gemmataceae bacterium]|nr:hypothetical protein [Gemmataceae bacterium]
MRRRAFVIIGLLLAGGLGGVLTYPGTHGQGPADPPGKLPPEVIAPTPIGRATPAVVPAAAAAPARKPAPFDRFSKYDELPDLTRQLVFATRGGMEWLSRPGVHQSNGRFVTVDPGLGTLTEDGDFIRQALGAFALARAARLTGDEKYAVRSAQTILSLLAETPKDPANPAARKPVQTNVVCNRVGAAAHLALAIYELPDATPELLHCGEQLCQFLRGQLQADGSVRHTEPGDPPDPGGATRYPGPALAALAVSHKVAPADWKKEALARGVAFYRKQFRADPSPGLVPWLTAAFAEMHLQTRDPVYAEAVFEMCDWLRQLQYDSQDRARALWRGGFPAVADGKVVQSPPTAEAGCYALGLVEACRMIRQMDRPDAARYDQYRAAVVRAFQFLTTLQYGDENTQHLAAHFRPAVLGAFHPSHTDGGLRVDHTAAVVAALSQYLITGADR